MRALFEIFVVTIIIDGTAFREVCLRVRPQGGRAVFILDVDSGDVVFVVDGTAGNNVNFGYSSSEISKF
jgi:hypothetical protein